jgi:hypothetical protein
MTLTNTSDHAATNTSDDGAADKSIEAQMEGEIRQFVRRDIATVRPKPKNDSEMVANNIGSLLQRVAVTAKVSCPTGSLGDHTRDARCRVA